MSESVAARIIRLGPELHEPAAIRLVGDRAAAADGGGPTARTAAARRFLATAGTAGINLDLMWGAIGPEFSADSAAPRVIEEVCLAVVGAGRTANLFISSAPRAAPRKARSSGKPEDRGAAAHAARVAVINEACRFLAQPGAQTGPGVALAQSLLEPDEQPGVAAFAAAGFQRVGELSYLRRTIPRSHTRGGGAIEPELPPGFSLRPMTQLADDSALAAALEWSYENTLDCPELTGMRAISDVIESHRAVGRHDPALWWVLLGPDDSGKPSRAAGCLLLNPSPEQDSVELVYLGLAESVRGRGLGWSMLQFGMKGLAGRSERWITCAVDTRNPPALRLYRRAGFENFATRIPMVRRLGP